MHTTGQSLLVFSPCPPAISQPASDPAFWSDAPNTTRMVKLMPLWEALLNNTAVKFPETVNDYKRAIAF